LPPDAVNARLDLSSHLTWLRTADGFAVCSSTNFAALVGLCILTWIKEADCDPVVEIMSRVPNEGAVFRAD